MKLFKMGTRSTIDRATLCFLIGVALAMLALWFPFIPAWKTFIHMWRVETAASLVLIGILCYTIYQLRHNDFRLVITREEWRFIVLPVTAFILWSTASAMWAPSWKSALHHSFIWTEYLIFYIVFRQILERDYGLRAILAVFALTLVFYSLPAVAEYCAYLMFGGATTLGMRFAKYGEQIVTILPLLLLGVIRSRGKEFAAGAIVVTLLWLLIFCTFGRANYLLFAAGVVSTFFVVLISRHYRRYTLRLAAICCIVLLAPLALHVFSLFSAQANASVVRRLDDPQGMESSNNFRKLMIAVSTEMIRENPVMGFGADNFGMQLNEYRRRYGATNPQDGNLAYAEAQIPSHAHNEYLQITTELGIVGLGIFCWFLAGIGILGLKALWRLRTGSPYPAAAVLGLGMFLASSMVSSYSFRVMQNGIVFFFVLAVASRALRGTGKAPAEPAEVPVPVFRLKWACAAGILVCVSLITYSGLRVSSVALTARANQTRSTDQALPIYQLAMRLDDENPDVRHNLGMRLFKRRRYEEAVPYLQAAVQIGRAPSAELSYLATAKTFSGDEAGAEATIKYASEMYPRSTFVLARYSALLESHGRTAEAAAVFERAAKIDQRAAASWRAVIQAGPKALSEMAARDKSYIQTSELGPEASMFAIVTERYIKFPDEQRFSLVKVSIDEE